MSKSTYDPNWIPPPGATVEDLLVRSGTARPKLLGRLGEDEAQQLFSGRLAIDAKIATLLASVVGMSAAFWLEREKLYRSALARRKYELQLLAKMPVEEMKARQFIPAVASHDETMSEVVKFFGETDSKSCGERIDLLPNSVKQKTSRAILSLPGSLAVWIRAGELEAERTECATWSARRLEAALPDLRRLTRTEDPATYLPELRRLCAACGVALVILRAPSGCVARGAVKILGSKAMLLLSARHLSNDQFWFSFFHEVAHLLLHRQEESIIDDWDDSVTEMEIEADNYAAEVLVPPHEQAQLLLLRDRRSIIAFARRLDIARGIVVGQMQYRQVIRFNQLNNLKIYYQWNSEDEIELKSERAQ